MTRALVIARKKEQYAPIVDAVQRTGLPILDFSDDLTGFDQLIVFHNKYFEPLHTNAKVGWWMCDYRKPHELVALPQKNCHHIFLPFANHHHWFTDHFGVPVTFMPQCGVEWPAVPNPRRLHCDVVFIGNVGENQYHSNRSAIITELERYCKVQVISGERSTPDMREIFQQVRIVLNITPPGAAGCSNRLYNILSSGGLCLTTWFEGIEKLFTNYEHLVWFDSVSDLDVVVRHNILTNPMLMDHIRQQAKRLYQQKHTAQHRIDNMFDILSGTETGFRGFLTNEK